MTEDRVARVLADMVEPGGDPITGDAAAAATVLILRDGATGLEVLMTERPDRGSFAGAWVFPGGKIEPGDAGATEADVARAAGVRETWEETGLIVAPDALEPLSRWSPPPTVALRIRTWFFVTGDPGGTLTLAEAETVGAEWVRPADALARHGRGEFTLYPPTWVTLHHLAGQQDVADVLAAARLSGLQEFETVAHRGADGPLLLWEGDADYDPDAGAAAPGARHRLDMSALPWTYTRS